MKLKKSIHFLKISVKVITSVYLAKVFVDGVMTTADMIWSLYK
ncbi:TPA: hypothetical protein ACGW69_005805 [Bacillus cereus]